jgi:hypothetical protein
MVKPEKIQKPAQTKTKKPGMMKMRLAVGQVLVLGG